MPEEPDSMVCDARIRYWEEEWLSQLLEEALRLKGSVSAGRPGRKTRASRVRETS
ncbi:MAG: hypothetical protein QXQ13_08100 [Thermoplasmata archaeon]